MWADVNIFTSLRDINLELVYLVLHLIGDVLVSRVNLIPVMLLLYDEMKEI